MTESDTFGRRIGLGFIFITLILTISVGSSLWKVTKNAELQRRLTETRAPMVRSSLSLLDGVSQSMAGIRGLLLLDEKESRVEREQAWARIDGAMLELQNESAADLGQLRERLEKLRNLQIDVDRLSRTDRSKSLALLREKAAPFAYDVRDTVEKLVKNQDAILKGEIEESAQNTRALIWLEWILLGVGVLSAAMIGAFITRNVTEAMRQAVEAAKRLANEDFDFEVALRGPREIEIFGQALEKMRGNLRALTEGLRTKNDLLQAQSWQIDGQVGLLESMAGNQSVKTLAGNILSFLCGRVNAKMGAFYLAEANVLTPIQGYAHHEKLLDKKFQLGEGMAGRAALDGRLTVVDDLPSDYFKIHSGLGESLPHSLALLPVIYNGNVAGIIELASAGGYSETHLQFLTNASRNIGVAVNLNLSMQKTKELLEETQAQSEELQAQQEELKAANEELENKTKSLEASEEELRSQQEELRSTNEELEEQTLLLEREKETLGSRTQELEQIKRVLETRAKEVEQVSRYKSEFLANMSHELRTPLNSILMLSQSLTENRNQNLNERQMKALNTIHSSGSDLLTLIEDILDLSKVEAGKLEIKPEPVFLVELFDMMKQSFEPMAREGRLGFELQIENGLPRMFTVDPTRVKQVLKNLLSNAFKFTNQGSVTLSVFRPQPGGHEFRLQRQKIPCLAFTVKDTGIGIPKEDLQSVFDAFKQLDAKTTRKYGGTGLGLSIVRELVGLLGGEIRLESEEGVGTTVTICLPEAYALQTAQVPQEAASSPELRPSLPESRVVSVEDDRASLEPADSVVLIVEDDLRFANSLLDLCRDNGFKGVVLNDGISAVKLAEELVPQGILLDLSLPELDGSDVIKLLKENPKTRHIPIQVITGHDRRQEVLNAGAMGFLRKPTRNEELKDVLKKLREFSTGKNKRLLVVEDDQVQRQSIREFIEMPGLQILEAETGQAGLDLLKAGDIDCIILDLKLPDMGGNEFLSVAKGMTKGEIPPVIIYTGRDLADAELRELEKNSKSIIVKSAKSPERLFDEAMMFLHRLQKDLPAEKRKIIENLHDHKRILRGKKVLVVDDDPRNILSLTHLLEDHGMVVIEATNGQEALDVLGRDESVDLILMDMMMPEMDGYEATRRLRKTTRYQSVPIVALTARAMRGERERCLEAGCDDYLSKPIENDKLISLLRVWLYRSA